MNELIVKIKYTHTTTPFSAADVQKAMEHLFGINTDFEVEEIHNPNDKNSYLKQKQCDCRQEYVMGV